MRFATKTFQLRVHSAVVLAHNVPARLRLPRRSVHCCACPKRQSPAGSIPSGWACEKKSAKKSNQSCLPRRRAIPITEVAAEPLIGLTREDYPNYYDYLSLIFSKLKQKPRVVEEHDSFSAVMSAVEAGTGVAIATDFGYSFGNRLKFLHVTPEPKPISVGIVGTKGRLSPAAERFWQCAKEAASKK